MTFIIIGSAVGAIEYLVVVRNADTPEEVVQITAATLATQATTVAASIIIPRFLAAAPLLHLDSCMGPSQREAFEIQRYEYAATLAFIEEFFPNEVETYVHDPLPAVRNFYNAVERVAHDFVWFYTRRSSTFAPRMPERRRRVRNTQFLDHVKSVLFETEPTSCREFGIAELSRM